MISLERTIEELVLPLSEKTIHPWWLSIPALEPMEEDLSQILSADEKERAARYRFKKDRLRFVIGRASLRLLLSSYLSLLPHQLRFTISRFGKPSLQTPSGGPDLRFNVSHSGNGILLAFVLGTRLGIDVEEVRTISNMEAVAKRCLSPEQFREFRQGDFGDLQEAFFRFWTRKEALIKALGTGLSQSLTAFDVTLKPQQPPTVTRAPLNFGCINKWTLYDLEVTAGYQATLAIYGTGYVLKPVVRPS